MDVSSAELLQGVGRNGLDLLSMAKNRAKGFNLLYGKTFFKTLLFGGN